MILIQPIVDSYPKRITKCTRSTNAQFMYWNPVKKIDLFLHIFKSNYNMNLS